MKLEIAINKAFKELKKNNIKTAMLDSELLMSKVINKNREFIILNSEVLSLALLTSILHSFLHEFLHLKTLLIYVELN